MPIKPVLGPQKMYLEQADPTRGTWVDIRRRTYRDDIARGEWLRSRTLVDMPDGSMATKVEVNVPRVRMWELYMTYVDCNIEMPDGDAENAEKLIKPFKPKDEMTYEQFAEVVGGMPPEVIGEWIGANLIVNPEWRTFF